MVGDAVHKVGRTTGWTFGTVLFCQSLMQAGGGLGDSGPVGVFSPLEGIEADLGPLKINQP